MTAPALTEDRVREIVREEMGRCAWCGRLRADHDAEALRHYRTRL
jgi:hypothetical protein